MIDTPSAPPGRRPPRARGRRLASRAAGVSLAISLAVHAAVLTVAVTTGLRVSRRTEAELLLPRGVTVVELRRRPERAEVRQAPALPRMPDVPRVSLEPVAAERATVAPPRVDPPEAVPPVAEQPAPEFRVAADRERPDPRLTPRPPAPPQTPAELSPPLESPPEPGADAPVETLPTNAEPTPPQPHEDAITGPVDVPAPPEDRPAPADEKRGVETGAEVVHLPAPRYPAASRRRGEEGLVLLKVVVLPEGVAGQILVMQSAGAALLDEAAVEAARKARFRPATRDGIPVESRVIIPVRFERR